MPGFSATTALSLPALWDAGFAANGGADRPAGTQPLSRRLIAGRMVDLEAIIRQYFYHPGFRGSTSIKRVLPALVPGMSYAGMAIGDGDTAMAAFASLAHGRYAGEEEGAVRAQLLAYCAQDTMAMIRLHEALLAYP